MEHPNKQNKYSIKMSIESRQSVGSGCRSLQRPSWSERQNSLTKKHSLIEVMSLESGRKSDIYDKLLDVNSPMLGRQSAGGIAQENNYYAYGNYNEGLKLGLRRSDEDQSTLNHACKCYTECEWQTCPCSQSQQQLCIEGFCCRGCIEHKNANLQGNAPIGNVILCTCKKTKCNKKYCSCFAAGVLCGDKCTCEGCINCIRPPQQKMEIEMQEENDIPEEQLLKMPMPENMDFQPVQFRFSNNI